MQRTVAFADDEQRPFDREDMPAGPQQQDVVRLLHWKPGAEVPPFLSSNTAVVALLSGLVDGTVHEVPSIIVSEAIAVQIYLLVFDEQLCAEVLKDIGYSGLYIILGSLALRRRIEPPDDKARKRLQSEMERKSTPSNRRAPGLVLAFREKVKKRERDLEMVGMTADAARDHLLLRWDANPFSFNWGEQLMAVDEAAATTFCALVVARSSAPRLLSPSVHSRACSQLVRLGTARSLACCPSSSVRARGPPLPRPCPGCASAGRCARRACSPSRCAGRMYGGRLGRRSGRPRAVILHPL